MASNNDTSAQLDPTTTWIVLKSWISGDDFTNGTIRDLDEDLFVHEKITMRLSQVVYFQNVGAQAYAYLEPVDSSKPALGRLDADGNRLIRNELPLKIAVREPKRVRATSQKKKRSRDKSTKKTHSKERTAKKAAVASEGVAVGTE